VIIEILEQEDNEGDGSRVVDEFKIAGIDPLRIIPVHDKVGTSLTIQETKELVSQIKPRKLLRPDELDSYYAQNIPVLRNGNLSPDLVDIPHHIGLRVVLESILQKYGKSNHLLIRIS
jgi:hypothetical protein